MNNFKYYLIFNVFVFISRSTLFWIIQPAYASHAALYSQKTSEHKNNRQIVSIASPTNNRTEYQNWVRGPTSPEQKPKKKAAELNATRCI